MLQKQLSNQEQQKTIINDLHELEKSFNDLKSNLLTLFSSIKNTESVSIDNEIGNIETQLVSLSSGLEYTENEIL